MSKNIYDLIVVGGGVNGCGIARDAAIRGLKVMLVEKGDFSAGTTWASSGMIHGGPRYLLDDINITKRSCTDSGYIQKIVPHLIFRIPFFMTVLKTGIAPVDWFMLEATKTFTEVYDHYQPLKGGKPSLKFSAEQVSRIEPLIKADLKGAISFDEYGIDCPRLCLVNALDAKERGATVYNHTEVIEFLKTDSAVTGVRLKHRDGSVEDAFAQVVVNATGPWAPQTANMAGGNVKLRPAKGVHIIYPGRVSNFAITFSTADGRMIFIMPHENISMLGTTDDDFYGDPDDIHVLWDEVRYLHEAAARIIPAIERLRPMRVIAGIRPTIFEWGKLEDKLTRDHDIVDHGKTDNLDGLYSMIGGKLASYREMSEEMVDVVMKKLGRTAPCQSHKLSMPGGDAQSDPKALAETYGQPLAVTRRLAFRHGSRAQRVLELMKEKPAYSRIIDHDEPVTEAEIRYVIREEMAFTIGDITRRTRLGDGPTQGRDSVFAAGVILGEELGLSTQQVLDEVQTWFNRRWKEQHAVMKGSMAQAVNIQASLADVFAQREGRQ